jgi:hypothetical protein
MIAKSRESATSAQLLELEASFEQTQKQLQEVQEVLEPFVTLSKLVLMYMHL